MIDKEESKTITFWLGGMLFEYDEWKNEYNIMYHGISFKQAARVFFDYDRIELFDEDNSDTEDRYDTIGDLAAGYTNTMMSGETVIGSTGSLSGEVNDIVFVVYTERAQADDNGKRVDVTRLISARLATDFERGYIMVNTDKMTAEIIEELAFSEEELALLAKARNIPISFDEDCPETTPERALKFRRVNPPRDSIGRRA